MKITPIAFAIISTFVTVTTFSQSRKIDLQVAVKEKKIEVVNRQLTLVSETGYPGIRLDKQYGEGIVWLNGIEFSNGSIEFDVRGEDLEQHSFVGIAFCGKNDSTFDAIYLRPFQFNATDEMRRDRSIQYISLPEFTWRKLRERSPGKFENSIDPSPDPNSWVKMRVVIQDKTISTYINGSKEPSLVAEKLSMVKSGRIGLYVADTSGGDFANLVISPQN